MCMTKETLFNRPIAKRVRIEEEGDFATYHKAEEILKAEGFRTGSMCSPEPTGFAPADRYEYIAKWRNIDHQDRKLLHGVIQTAGGNFRNGPLEIVYFEDVDSSPNGG
jgi:hypothetical protein